MGLTLAMNIFMAILAGIVIFSLSSLMIGAFNYLILYLIRISGLVKILDNRVALIIVSALPISLDQTRQS